MTAQMRMSGATPGPHIPATRGAWATEYKNTIGLIIAQLVAAAQGIMGLISGIALLDLSFRVNSALGDIGLGGVGNAAIVVGIVVIVISLTVVVSAFRAGSPSSVPLWLLLGWEVVAALLMVGILADPRVILAVPEVFVVIAASVGLGFMSPGLALVMQVVIILGLVLHLVVREPRSQ